MHSTSFESSDQEPIPACFVESVAALLRYVMTFQNTPSLLHKMTFQQFWLDLSISANLKFQPNMYSLACLNGHLELNPELQIYQMAKTDRVNISKELPHEPIKKRRR